MAACSRVAGGAVPEGGGALTDDLGGLRAAAARGDRDAVGLLAVLVELSGEREDLPELRRLADAGSTDARDVLLELLGEDTTD